MSFDNEAAKERLVALLRQPRCALLLVGSGSSLFVGYPSWTELVDGLRERVIPELPFPDGLSLPQRAAFVQNNCANDNDRRRQYRQHLEEQFRNHEASPSHAPFHRLLAQIAFCGIATTNYDPVIDTALSWVRVQKGLDPCTTIDLCSGKRHRVFEYLRSLNGYGHPPSVLHLHGYWENPDDLVLTERDYAERYGMLERGESAPLATSAIGDRRLDTLHRKVLWALLTMRQVLFIGFSLEDPAFQLVLTIVREDFDLAPDPAPHYALFPASSEDRREYDAEVLKRIGVMPVFYHVVTDSSGKENHDALPKLVEDIGARLGIFTGVPSIDVIARGMMER